ncbi:MAG: hypothetical protein ABFD62_15010 [Syntrophaceae bacterium]
MNQLEKTQKGFPVGRRCDVCGRRAVLALDSGDHCVLICTTCRREYRFFLEQ